MSNPQNHGQGESLDSSRVCAIYFMLYSIHNKKASHVHTQTQPPALKTFTNGTSIRFASITGLLNAKRK